MSLPASRVRERDELEGHHQGPPSKKPRSLACFRCRGRKQKCDEKRPCANCTRSGEQCHEVQSWTSFSISLPESVQLQQTVPTDVTSLEHRIARLEQLQWVSANQATEGNGSIAHAPETRSDQTEVMHQGPVNPEADLTLSPACASPTIGLFSTFAGAADTVIEACDAGLAIDADLRTQLFRVYQHTIHCRYPFLLLQDIQDSALVQAESHTAYFLNMIYSISLLVSKKGIGSLTCDKHQSFYRAAVTRNLATVLAHNDRILHIQAYLLLAMHALYSPSTEKLVSIASTTMRYCVLAQMHLGELEPGAVNLKAKIDIQLRRRVFWSAYALDRAVGTMFDLPFSIPDYQITVKHYANLNDEDMERECSTSQYSEPSSSSGHTTVSAALHVVYCRQIQSEILNTTLHRDFKKRYDRLTSWRLHILRKLDRCKSLCHRYWDPSSSAYSTTNWLHMIYNFSLTMLYRTDKESAIGAAGDWTMKCCIQMSLIGQFKCGVSLLYCYFATPQHLRTEAYDVVAASEAVRVCSIILSLLAERWSQSSCLRDSFEILAREISLQEPSSPDMGSGQRKMRHDSSNALLALLPRIATIVIHRDILRMLRETATEDYPATATLKEGMVSSDESEVANIHIEHEIISSFTSTTGDILQPMLPTFLTDGITLDHVGGFDYADIDFPGSFDIDFAF